MKKNMLMLTLFMVLAGLVRAQHGSARTADFDRVVREQLPVTETGAAVLVSRHGKIIYKKAVGKANAELNVPMQTSSVFRIASVTKQFTAIAILQLFENGQLGLQDAITRFLPDYPTQGAKITIENLLTHTSGIRDYASIRDTTQRGKVDFTPAEMVNYFKNEPLRFAPGTRYEYSNSNYFLLGCIIEKITGKPYEQYLEEHFFGPLGMTSSYYGSDTKVIRNRASGYTAEANQTFNAAGLSMTQPYAAGAILSTVEDLFKWNNALQSYRLVKKETLGRAFTRHRLSDGKESNYGFGFRFGNIQGSPSVWHGGLINGFMSMAMYLPKEDVYVAVLSNCNCVSPEKATALLAALAIGKPFDFKEVTLPDSTLQAYTGIFENDGGDRLTFTAAAGKLYSQRGRGPKVPVKASGKGRFFIEDILMTMEFSEGPGHKADRLAIGTRNGTEMWRRVAKPLAGNGDVNVEERILETYTGAYEVNPQFIFTVTKEKDRLFLQAPGQEKLELFAETAHKFYLKVNDAQLEFVSESGTVSKVILKQGGRTTDALKIK